MSLIVDFSPASRSFLMKDVEKRVQFSNEVQVYSVYNLKVNFKARVWFSKKELRQFRAGITTTLSQISSDNRDLFHYATDHIEDTSVFMGLENFLTYATLKEVILRRQLYKEGVLDEYKRQADASYYDPNEMRRISEGFSEWSRMRARVIARIHAAEDQE